MATIDEKITQFESERSRLTSKPDKTAKDLKNLQNIDAAIETLNKRKEQTLKIEQEITKEENKKAWAKAEAAKNARLEAEENARLSKEQINQSRELERQASILAKRHELESKVLEDIDRQIQEHKNKIEVIKDIKNPAYSESKKQAAINKEQKSIDLLQKQKDRISGTSFEKLAQKLTSKSEAFSSSAAGQAGARAAASKAAGAALGATAKAATKLVPVVGVASAVVDATKEVSKTVIQLGKKLDSQINSTASFLEDKYGKVTAAIYGSGDSFREMADDIATSVIGSRFVKQTEVLTQIASLAEAGTAYNLEERAIVESLANKITPTFSSIDGSLLQLIRIAQNDVTMAQLGVETQLKRLLNNSFQDTQYLRNLYDSVTGDLLDAVSTKNANQTTAFNSTVQTWLGYMYESGVSSGVVEKLANALNMLGSGNVSGLEGSGDIQRLLLLSMKNAGQNYADILQTGLDADTVNTLMSSMVKYLNEIATTTENNKVLTSAYTDLFGMSMRDIQAMTTMIGKMGSISTVNSTAAARAIAADEQALAIENRFLESEKINNMIDNSMYMWSQDMAMSAPKYLGWKGSMMMSDLADMLERSGILSGVSTAARATAAAGMTVSGGAGLVSVLGDMLSGAFTDSNDWVDAIGAHGSIKGGGKMEDRGQVASGKVKSSAKRANDAGSKSFLSAITGSVGDAWEAVADTGGKDTGKKAWNIAKGISGLLNFFSPTGAAQAVAGAVGATAGAATKTAKIESISEEDLEKSSNSNQLKILREIEDTIMQDEDGHKAIAVFLTGMKDSTLRSFASIFADEENMGLTSEDANQAYKLIKFDSIADASTTDDTTASSKDKKKSSTTTSKK